MSSDRRRKPEVTQGHPDMFNIYQYLLMVSKTGMHIQHSYNSNTDNEYKLRK
jgi:hypothetical protein